MSCSAIPLPASSRTAAWAAPRLSKSPMTVLAIAPPCYGRRINQARRVPSGLPLLGLCRAVATLHLAHQNVDRPSTNTSSKYEHMADSALDIAVELVRDRASLARISAQWEELARHALEPSPLHDPAMTLALLE